MVSHSTTEILAIETPQLFDAAVHRAVRLLRNGEVVALPTETVYGLAANALDARAVSKIFELKGRPSHNPIIVHISSLDMAQQCVSDWPVAAENLARAFWPGPLTLVLPRLKTIPDVVTSGGDTVGLRWPSHPLIRAVIQECGFPLAAPSANLANSVSPTNAEHVRKYFEGRIPLLIDGGQCQVGIESTVVDVSTMPPRLLRPGMIHEEALLAVTGKLEINGPDDGLILKSPGRLKRHYSPKARLKILPWKDDAELLLKLSSETSLTKTHIVAHTRIPSGGAFGGVSVIPHDPEAFARAIYAQLHHCDEAGAELIVVGDIPNSSEWRAIADRLKRAASQS